MKQPTITLKLCDNVLEGLKEIAAEMGHKSPEAFASILLMKSLHQLQGDLDEWLYLRRHYEETERLWLTCPDGVPNTAPSGRAEIDDQVPF
jgi:hypothetical protein